MLRAIGITILRVVGRIVMTLGMAQAVYWFYHYFDPSAQQTFGVYAGRTLLVVALGCALCELIDPVVRMPSVSKQKDESQEEKESTTSYPPVEPLPNFRWQDTEPLQFRPLKPKYNLTMSIENCTASDLIELDKNYLDRIKHRRELMTGDTRSQVLGATNDALVKPAIDEFYTWLIGTYLPTRFPLVFQLDPDKKLLYNTATAENIPLAPAEDPVETLERLGGTLEDDFLFLVSAPDGDGYKLGGFVTCFPNGFDTSKKLGLKLREIHAPVPGYKKILERSMDRFFDKLEDGRFVKRHNWAINTDHKLCAPGGGHHLYEGDAVPEPESIRSEQTYLRSERQILHRLPQTKAILFSFKTYMYPIEDVKDEGSGERLAQAIEGLTLGNVPGMHFYKRAIVWAESVKEYLRS